MTFCSKCAANKYGRIGCTALTAKLPCCYKCTSTLIINGATKRQRPTQHRTQSREYKQRNQEKRHGIVVYCILLYRVVMMVAKAEDEVGRHRAEFENLPEGCIANVLSFTTPRDACALSLVSSAFRSAAQSDVVWERFLPSDYRSIISQSQSSDLSLTTLTYSKKDLYLHLCHKPLLIDSGKKVLIQLPLFLSHTFFFFFSPLHDHNFIIIKLAFSKLSVPFVLVFDIDSSPLSYPHISVKS